MRRQDDVLPEVNYWFYSRLYCYIRILQQMPEEMEEKNVRRTGEEVNE